MAVWGLPREARFPDQMSWWESAVEVAVRPLPMEDRSLVGVNLLAMPPRLLFRTRPARARLYDRYLTPSKGLGTLGEGAGKKGKSGGVQLKGGPRLWPAWIETERDEDKKALLCAARDVVKYTLGFECINLVRTTSSRTG